MARYMLDTNIAIYVIKHRPIEALERFNEHAGNMGISSITLAELMHGVEKSSRPAHNNRQVEDFVSRLDVLEYDRAAAFQYGRMREELERQGKTIGVNDLHLAGHACSRAMVLVSNNLKEFIRVSGLQFENWVV